MIASLILAMTLGAAEADRARMVLVVGTGGEPEYERLFAEWAARWQAAAKAGQVETVTIGQPDAEAAATEVQPVNDRERLKLAIEAWANGGAAPRWLVFIGHGTFDGRTAKFNLRGPDVSAEELSAWLSKVDRPLVIIDASASSAPVLKPLAREGRIVVTATKSGYEQNFARFGEYLGGAIASTEADLDKDGQTSLLEAFLTASRRTAEFYAQEARLATETALLDDNGDGLGTPADWFRGIRAVKKAQGGASLDGARAHQAHLVPSTEERRLPPAVRRRRDELELEIARLREARAADDDAYYAGLEPLLIELAELYETIDAAAADDPADDSREAGPYADNPPAAR